MNPDLFRAIDKYVGAPACAVASGLARISPGLSGKGGPASPAAALFIQLSEMGSAVLASPAVARFREAHPDCAVHWLTFRHNRRIVDALGLVPPENVIAINVTGAAAFLSSTRRAVAEVRARRVDTVFDFELFARFSALVSALSGARRRVGFSMFHQEGLYRGSLLTHPVLYNCHQHVAKNFLAQVLALERPRETPLVKEAINQPLSAPRFVPDPAAAARVKDLLYDLCPQRAARHLVLLNPGAGELLPLRAWPVEHFARLGRMILENHDALLAVVGPPEARPLGLDLSSRLPRDRVADMTGRTDLPEFLELLSAARLIVTADSGAAHFASLTHTPRVVLFGPETPTLYAPLGDRVRTLTAGLACSPCLSAFNHRKSPCKDAACMREILPESVYAAAVPFLENGDLVAKIPESRIRA